MIQDNSHLESMKWILVTDVGSTTTKARLFYKKNGEWRFYCAGEAPTTVEAPYEDVTLGVINSVREVEELTGHNILLKDGRGIEISSDGNSGVDLYCTTSSAGGGLQMMVAGVIINITAESANRAALGAGAIVMDVIAIDDGREDYEKINRIRNLRPDMILVAGGTDGGAETHVSQIVDLIKASKPQPRLGITYQLPVVYAGNKELHGYINDQFGEKFALSIVDNIRPTIEEENIEPARRAIHELFMEHVMSHAPGYDKLMKWTDVDIMPTPAGEGIAMQFIAKQFKVNMLGVGLGGATTNIYSVFEGRFVRSVSANLGMSYSIGNVMKEAGVENIIRWLPFQIDENVITNRLINKMIRPTIIPQTLEMLILEHAVAREALRLGLRHHKTIATRLKGVTTTHTLDDVLREATEESYIKMMDIDVITGTGGLLSHAPRRSQSLLILIDAFQPEGITRMFQDSVFMMPHLGVLSTIYPNAAWNIFDKDCLIRLGTVIAPSGIGKLGQLCLNIKIEMLNGKTIDKKLNFGQLERIDLSANQEAKIMINPQHGFNVGAGSGHKLEIIVTGGLVGVIFDCRGRPLQLPENMELRKNLLLEWYKKMNLYPLDKLN